MVEEAQRLIKAIKQMESSLEDERASGRYSLDDCDLRISYPLNKCLATLKEKYNAVSKLHRERFEQVKSKYSSEIDSARDSVSNYVQSLSKPSNPTPLTSSRPLYRSHCPLRHPGPLFLLVSISRHHMLPLWTLSSREFTRNIPVASTSSLPCARKL